MTIYVVQSGDTLTAIAERYGVTVNRLASDNGITSDTPLAVGQALLILTPAVTYTVEAGDTLLSVAERYGVSIDQLWRNNPSLNGGTALTIGETLVIRYTDTPTATRIVNGYVYPFIDRTVLRRTLPYLTWLTVFTYGFTEDGTLIQPDDTEVVAIAREYGVAPILLLSTLTDDGVFSNQRASALLRNPAIQETVINQALAVMMQKGYRGMDIDFEYVLPEDTEAYVQFVQYAADRLREAGYISVVSLAPKTNAAQKGLLYESHDYPALGNAADYAFLMTYEWGYTYGPSMAIAPLNKVREVVSYAVTEIAPDKLLMGIPNYAYDFALPYVRGESKAEALSNVQAVQRAVEKGANIQFDETAQSPFYTYTQDGVVHEVWFEDPRSVQASLALAQEFQLSGVGYWNIMRWFPQNWLILNSQFQILQDF